MDMLPGSEDGGTLGIDACNRQFRVRHGSSVAENVRLSARRVHGITFQPEKKQQGAQRRYFWAHYGCACFCGDEWKFASERGSIQPRAVLLRRGKLSILVGGGKPRIRRSNPRIGKAS